MTKIILLDVCPELYRKWELFDQKMQEVGISYIITSTARKITEQMALYTQGRMPLEDINKFRKAACMPYLTETYNKVVTWTLQSKHVTNLYDTDMYNDQSRAFDIALKDKEGKVHWDVKISVNDNEIPDYEEVGKIGESVGLKWGGRFQTPDYPHFELS